MSLAHAPRPSAPPVFNPLDPAFIADPYPTYHRLREFAPVWKTPLGMWLTSRYEDCALVLRDRRYGKDFAGSTTRRAGPAAMQELAVANLARTMLVADPPDHTRLRGLVVKAFTARRVEEMRPRIAAIVDALIDRVADQGHMDLVWDFAHRLPVIVICDMLGIPEEDRQQFFDQSRVNARLLDPVPLSREEMDRANANSQAMGLYFDHLFELRRRSPGEDLTTLLIQAEEAGDRLSPAELRANIGLLFGAGHETTANLIGNGMLALHRNPAQWRLLQEQPELVPNAIEEMLRYDSSVQISARVTMEDVELGGEAISAGETIITLLGAANRDPAVFAEPDRLDVQRRDIKPISFGGGIHFCLGAQLARLEGEIAFTRLMQRLPGLTLPEKDRPDWRQSFTLRGLQHLPVTWQ